MKADISLRPHSVADGWLDGYPARWSKKRLKYCARLINGRAEGSYSDLACIRLEDIESWTGRCVLSEAADTNDGQKNLSQPGDVLFGKLRPYLAKVLRVREASACTGELLVLRPHSLTQDFLFYYMLARDFIEQVNSSSYGVKMPRANWDFIGALPALIPPEDEQRAIASFLDRETARIDSLIAKKQRQIELLEEKRSALIIHAVTRGLDPKARMKASGMNWLSEIPAHWERRRIAWLFRERDLRGMPDLPLLEVSINAGVVRREFSEDRIESTAADFNTYKVARKGDIVFNKMRMWQGAVGVAPEDGLVSSDYTVAAPIGTLSSDYAGYLFRTGMFSAECARWSHGIVWDRLRLYWDGFRVIEVPLPPLGEQQAIVASIRAETAKLDRLHAAITQSIVLIKERRTALITAAVTGRIDVRQEVAA